MRAGSRCDGLRVESLRGGPGSQRRVPGALGFLVVGERNFFKKLGSSSRRNPLAPSFLSSLLPTFNSLSSFISFFPSFLLYSISVSVVRGCGLGSGNFQKFGSY